MQYKIKDLQKTTVESLGKDKLTCTLIGLDNTENVGVSIWQDFPNFETLTFDSEIEGTIVVKQNGKYTNKTLYAPKAQVGGGNAPKGANIAKAQEKKGEMIKEAQENKEHGIMVSSTIRMAHEVALEMTKSEMINGAVFDVTLYKENFTQMRNYFINAWDNKQPF